MTWIDLTVIISVLTDWFFPTVVLASWSNSDVKSGKVGNISLIIPVAISYFFNTWKFGQVFIPGFIFMMMLFFAIKMINKRVPVGKLIGFADIIGVPFAISWLPIRDPIAMVAFTIPFVILVTNLGKRYYDSILKTSIRSRVKLMPVMFLSYFAAIAVHFLWPVLI
jgi:hypothetical protein